MELGIGSQEGHGVHRHFSTFGSIRDNSMSEEPVHLHRTSYLQGPYSAVIILKVLIFEQDLHFNFALDPTSYTDSPELHNFQLFS